MVIIALENERGWVAKGDRSYLNPGVYIPQLLLLIV